MNLLQYSIGTTWNNLSNVGLGIELVEAAISVVVVTSWHWPSATCCHLHCAYGVIVVVTFSMLERGRRLLRVHRDGVVVVVTFSVLARGRCPRRVHGDNVGVVVTFAIHMEMVSSSSSSMMCWHGVISLSCARR